MNEQFGRKYRVLVYQKSGNVALDVSELRCVFRVEKIALSKANYAEVSIYNLAAETEQQILEEGARITIEAGYKGFYQTNGQYIADQYGQIWDGEILQFIRTREDNLDYVLTLVCLDRDSFLNNNIVAFTVNKGQNPRNILKSIASNALVPTELGRVSPDISSQSLPRGKVIFGEPKKYLRQIAKSNNAGFYVEDGKIYVEKSTDVAPGQMIVLTPQSGLIGTPQQTQEGVEFQCLLNPRIKLKTMIKLDNTYIRQMKQQIGAYPIMLDDDGQYQAYKVTHVGDSRGNDWYTEVVGIGRYGTIPLLLGNANQSPW